MSLGTLNPGICPDCNVDDIILDWMGREPAINEWITKQIYGSNPLMLSGSRNKKQFPAGQGDILRNTIMTTTVPTSSAGDIANWSAVKQAQPGYTPCATTPEQIRYGSYNVEGCLYQRSYKTHPFCVIDLTFKHYRDQYMSNLFGMFPAWTQGVHEQWYRASFRRNVMCIVINSQAGLPREMGMYPAWQKPTSVLTPAHMDELYMIQRGNGANLNPYTMVEGAATQVAFIGPEEFRMLEYLDHKANAGIGQRFMQVPLEKIGNVRVIGNYVYIKMDYPSRFGDSNTGGYVEIDSHVERAVTFGFESDENPNYRNPGVAKYTETVLWHVDATDWLMAPDFTGWGQLQFGMQNFAGDFKLVNFPTENDPRAKNAYFLAEYMMGMMPRFPRRALCVLSQAVHLRGKDVAECYINIQPTEPTKIPIRHNSYALVPNIAGGFTIKTATAIVACGGGSSLWALSQNGKRAKIAATDYSDTTGRDKVYIMHFTDTSQAVLRPCDPWVAVSCLSDTLGVDTASAADCLLCDPDPNGPNDDTPMICDYVATMDSATILNIKVGNLNLNGQAGFAFPYSVAANLQTALNAEIANLGGTSGTATVSKTGTAWVVTIVDTDLHFRAINGEAGQRAFQRTNCQNAPVDEGAAPAFFEARQAERQEAPASTVKVNAPAPARVSAAKAKSEREAKAKAEREAAEAAEAGRLEEALRASELAKASGTTTAPVTKPVGAPDGKAPPEGDSTQSDDPNAGAGE